MNKKVSEVSKKVVQVFGTLVSYRRVKDNLELEKEFTGDDHAIQAAEFCARHVRGLSDAEYKALSAADKEKFIRRKHVTAGSSEGADLWMRRKPLWTWHVMQPFSVERPA